MKPLIQIKPRDSKNLPHGYQEAKIDDSFVYRYKSKNGLEVGYEERHGSKITIFHIR
jgi:hypothetical protein